MIQTQNSDEEEALLAHFDRGQSETDEVKDEQDEDQVEKVLFTSNKEELSKFTAESINCAALDSCCTSSVTGRKWMNIFLSSMPVELQEYVKGPYKSKRTF